MTGQGRRVPRDAAGRELMQLRHGRLLVQLLHKEKNDYDET